MSAMIAATSLPHSHAIYALVSSILVSRRIAENGVVCRAIYYLSLQ